MGYMGIGGDIMIRLVKMRRNIRAGDSELIYVNGELERHGDGLVVKFCPPDNRKPGYAVFVELEELTDFIKDEKNKSFKS